MKYDPLSILLAYLKAQPEMAGVPVAADMVGHTTGSRRVVPVLAGGYRVVRNKADRWEIDLSVYGPDKRTVVPLALQVREILIERLPGTRLTGVTFSDVTELSAPHDFSDSVSSEQRFLNLLALFTYA